ncbi:MAG: SulP family inorganic anion transporter [Solitalea sp.]
MKIRSRRAKFYARTFLKHDFKASITVFFVALPLCLGIALASGTPIYSGLLAGMIGGLIVTLVSGSPLSVSGPAAGLTTICAAAIIELGSVELFFLSVALAGVLQVILGIARLGGFTQFIPSSVIKGMLSAIGILLIFKQIPVVIGYDQPEFWSKELFNIITFNHAFDNIGSIYQSYSLGVILVSASTLALLIIWKKTLARKFPFLPASFITVLFGILLSLVIPQLFPSLRLDPSHLVAVPDNLFEELRLPQLASLFSNGAIWKNAIVICFVASLETLLSIEAINKLDPYNRITPPNRELVAQGTGNFVSGLLGGLPITAVIVRSSANAEAGAKTKFASFIHGIWLLLVVLIAVPLVNRIPYCVLGVILIRTGYNLAKPSMIRGIYRQGREHFIPFLITVVAILFTDLLIGVVIGVLHSLYFIIKHTYKAGFTVREQRMGHTPHYVIEMASNVSFLNKKQLINLLDKIPSYSVVEIIGTHSAYIDHDILEIIQGFKIKARSKHIQLTLTDIAEVQTIEIH